MATWSKTWTFFEGDWREGNVPIMGVRSHATWLGSSVFDGARAFEGVTPDLDRHCARLNKSAKAIGLNPTKSDAEILAIAKDGVKKFGPNAELYIRPMYWGEGNGPTAVAPDPDDIGFCVSIYEAPMPKPNGFAITTSPYRRPHPDMAPVDAKAGCLYPNPARALRYARERGFDNAIMLDPDGNVAELATANLWLVKDGVAVTPAANGTFLAGITRLRTIQLLKDAGVKVEERKVTTDEVLAADELFSTGNAGKVQPITRVMDRSLQPGPMFRKARELYWAFAHSGVA
jgi:branched-chain amino acid aminotransferase